MNDEVDDVNSLIKYGASGIFIAVTNDTRAVLSHENPLDPMVVAVRHGQGRCLVFSHTGYVKLFTKIKEYQDQTTFVENCKRWVSRGSSSEIVKICDENTVDNAFINSLCEYLQSGRALICAATSWC